jgi:tetratricopeptide (TPR) repeat protein
MAKRQSQKRDGLGSSPKKGSQERPEQREEVQCEEDETVDSFLAAWLDGLESDDVEALDLARSIIREAPLPLQAPLRERIGELLELSRLTVTPSRYSAGERLGQYILTKKLGQGTTGTVWAAEDPEGRRVALKIIHPLYLSSSEGLRRLSVEVEAASRVHHPALVGLTGQLEEESVFALVTDLVGEGRTLADELTQCGEGEAQWHSRALVARLLDAVRGVSALHEANILHLDLKPANMLVADDMSLKVADLGLARMQDDPSLTRTIQVLGTPAYMSPELARGNRRGADKRSDVFALGAILFEILTLSRPFGSGSPAVVMRCILDEEPMPMPRILGEFSRSESRALRSIVGRCLEKDPEDRYPDAGALAQDLGRALGGQSVAGLATKRRLALIGRRHRRVALAGTLTVAMVGAAVIVANRQATLRGQAERALELATTITQVVGTGVRDFDQERVGSLVATLLEVAREEDVSLDLRRSLISSAGGLFCERGLLEDGLGLLELALGLEEEEQAADPHDRAHILLVDAYYRERIGDLEGAMTRQVRAARLLSPLPDEYSERLRVEALGYSWVNSWMLGMSGEAVAELLDGHSVQSLARDLKDAAPEWEKGPKVQYHELLAMRLKVQLEGVTPGLAGEAQKAVRRLEGFLGPDHHWVFDALAFDAWVSYKLGDHLVALRKYSNLKTRVEGFSGADDVRAAFAEFGMGTSTIHLASGELHDQTDEDYYLQRITPLFESAVSRLTAAVGPDSRLTLHARLNQAVGEGLCGRHEHKQTLIRDLLVDLDRCLLPSDPIRFTAYRGLYETYQYQGRFEEAGDLMAQRWRAYLDGLGAALPLAFRDIHDHLRRWPLVSPGAHCADLDNLIEAFVRACSTSPLEGAKEAADWVKAMADRTQAVREGDPERVLELREAARMPRLPMAWFETQWAPRDAVSASSVREYIWKNRNVETVSSLFVRSLALCRAGRLDEARASLARLDPMEADEHHRPSVKAQIAFAKARIMQAEGTPNGVDEILAASDGIEDSISLMRVILSHED